MRCRFAAIHIELSRTKLAMRCGEELIKVSDRPDGVLALQVLKDQLRTWIADSGKLAPRLLLTCDSSVEYATVKAILRFCRERGISQIELKTVPPDKAQKKEE
jgi:biopolymer transport protein ExbD